jgi:hypothetical protein
MIVTEKDVDIPKNISVLKINFTHFRMKVCSTKKDSSSIQKLVFLSSNKFQPTSAEFLNNSTNNYC